MDMLKALFWISALYGCLHGAAIPICKKSSLKVKQMKKIQCEPDSTFYTPQNVKPECLTAALDCVRRELEMAQQECQDPHEYIAQGIDQLNVTIAILRTDQTPDSTECTECETAPTANFITFLSQVETLCEMSNS